MTSAATARSIDSDKPIFHVMPRDGWLNDPNGPIFYAGRYHLFYQHVIGSSTWDWGLVWGHASSSDLINWNHEAIAIEPSADQYDADGCWSGNVAVGDDGTPTMLYTGVRLRKSKSTIPLPPPQLDLNLEQIETQCVAQCAPGDDLLIKWQKLETPAVVFPPGSLGKLTGFRDPFVIARKTATSPWKIIVGSGIVGQGGTVLLYHADRLASGWEYKGELVEGKSAPCQDGKEYDLGAMWECPFFVNLDRGSSSAAPVWMLCVSPYPHYCIDRPTNPCLYWLGSCEKGRFQLGKSGGPKLLDLGDVVYAPTLFAGTDRVLMVAWLQELRKGGAYDYAGCLSAPRVLTLQEGRLRQDPAPEILELRTGSKWEASALEVSPSQGIAIETADWPAQDITVTFQRGDSSASGVLLRAWLSSIAGEPASAQALLIDWELKELQVVSPDNLDTMAMIFDCSNLVKRIGGPIFIRDKPDSIRLRILIDHSVVEVFTEHGQALSTRVYRADAPQAARKELFLLSFGGKATVTNVSAHEMRSIWRRPEDVPEPWTAHND